MNTIQLYDGKTSIQAVSPKMERYIKVNVFDRESYVYAPDNVTRESLEEALDYTFTLLCNSCYAENVATDIMLLLTNDILVKKSVFRFGVKKHFKEFQKSLRNIIHIYQHYMNDDYYYEYSSIIYEKLEPKIEKLRKAIESKLRNLKVNNAYISSYLIILYNMMTQNTNTFTRVMEIVKRRYSVDLTSQFSSVYASMPQAHAQRLLDEVMRQDRQTFSDSITKNKDIIKLWQEATKVIYDPMCTIDARIGAFNEMPEETKALYNLGEDGFCELKEAK